jgi:hypothetical protein
MLFSKLAGKLHRLNIRCGSFCRLLFRNLTIIRIVVGYILGVSLENYLFFIEDRLREDTVFLFKCVFCYCL